MGQKAPKVSSFALALAAALLAQGCAAEREGRDVCTLETVGEDTGSQIVSVSLMIPESYVTGAEISNGGILVMNPDCDYALNAFLSDETADYLIDQAQDFRWVHIPSESKVAEADLYIWRFRDGSQEPRFFVLDVMELSEPKTAPRFSDRSYFKKLDND